jgi:hypothetical protein
MVATYQGKSYHLSGGRWRRKTASGSFLMPKGFTPYQTTQRRKKAKPKASRYHVPALKRNKDIKQISIEGHALTLGVNVGSEANGIANSLYTYPAMFSNQTPPWSQGVSADEFIGSWISPEYLKQKWRVEFPNIDATHADSLGGFLVRCTLVSVRIPGSKSEANTTSFANWAVDVDKVVKRETFQSNLDSDYLEFATANRNVKVIKSFTLNPNQNQKLKINYASDAVAPPICFSHNWSLPRFKQRVTKVDTGHGVMNDMFLLSAIFTCEQLSSNTGTINVDTSSRFYYTDS